MVKSHLSRKTLILRARTPERAAELLGRCDKLGYKAIVGIEPDKSEDITDLQRIIDRPRPAQLSGLFIPRNGPCTCGSGSKYKNCCGR